MTRTVPRLYPRHFILISAIILVIGIFTPFFITDRVSKYSGAQRIAAQAALDRAYGRDGFSSGMPYYLSYQRVTIDNVFLHCSATARHLSVGEEDCNDKESDPQSPQDYIVQYSKWTFFGLKVDTQFVYAGILVQ